MAEVTGGNRLEVALRGVARNLATGESVRIGFLEEATYPQRSTASLRKAYAVRAAKGKTGAISGAGGSVSVPMVAAIQEFGAPSRGIPPRPFFRNMIAAKSAEWGPAIGNLLVANNYDTAKVLAITGEAIAGQLRKSIIDTNAPPLAPSTIKRKGFAKPLIDTSHMINSIDYEVNT